MKNFIKITVLALIFTSFQSCYKRKDEVPIKGNVTCFDTINNKGVEGVKFIIYEEKKKHKGKEKIIFLEIETDQNGQASFEFKRPKNKKKWGYFLEIDENSIPDTLEFDRFNLWLKYGSSYSYMPLYNVYNEYDNNNISILFYPE